MGSVQEYIQWDIKSWAKALDYWEQHVDWSKIHTALELGGRQGGLSLWLAEKGIDTVCSDYQNTQAMASTLHEKHNVCEKIHYQDIDATNIPYENQFDLIVFKSIIGGIGKKDREIQRRIFNEIYKALKPGGVLLFAENMVATKVHQSLRKRANKWGDYWRYLTLEDLYEFMHNFSETTVLTTGFLATFGRNEKQKSIFNSADKFIFNPILPKKWKYIGYGIARK